MWPRPKRLCSMVMPTARLPGSEGTKSSFAEAAGQDESEWSRRARAVKAGAGGAKRQATMIRHGSRRSESRQSGSRRSGNRDEHRFFRCKLRQKCVHQKCFRQTSVRQKSARRALPKYLSVQNHRRKYRHRKIPYRPAADGPGRRD